MQRSPRAQQKSLRPVCFGDCDPRCRAPLISNVCNWVEMRTERLMSFLGRKQTSSELVYPLGFL